MVDYVQNAIAAGELKPGDRLPSERELVEKFSIGRASVREALRVLENMELVRSQPRDPAARWSCPSRPVPSAVLSRVATVVHRLFGVSYTLTGVAKLLHRLGRSAQRAAHRARERDERAFATWRREVWPAVKAPPPGAWPGSVSPTRPAEP